VSADESKESQRELPPYPLTVPITTDWNTHRIDPGLQLRLPGDFTSAESETPDWVVWRSPDGSAITMSIRAGGHGFLAFGDPVEEEGNYRIELAGRPAALTLFRSSNARSSYWIAMVNADVRPGTISIALAATTSARRDELIAGVTTITEM